MPIKALFFFYSYIERHYFIFFPFYMLQNTDFYIYVFNWNILYNKCEFIMNNKYEPVNKVLK